MHIPDGYIGPQTYGAAYALMLPIWAAASKILRRTLARKQVPLLALGAAFAFVVMFLNVPVMGRLTAHPVGAGLVAIVCGPWAACVAVSAALAVQAVPFGDGGITTFGANCLNLAVIAPFVSWGIFKVVRGSQSGGRRLYIASATGGYIGVVAAAAAVGIEMGLQPVLAGPGMYLPYSIKLALPAMLVPHLLIIGPLEAAITAAAVGYIYRTEPWILSPQGEKPPMSVARRVAIVSAAVLLLVPLGIWLPQLFGAGSAWGEWGSDELGRMLGYVPEGIRRGSGFWNAPLPDYALPGNDATPAWTVAMALAGGLAAVAVGLGLGRLLSKGGKDAAS